MREFPEAGHRIRKRSNVRALVERPIIIVHALKADRIEVLRFSMVREVGRKSVKLLDLTVNSRTNGQTVISSVGYGTKISCT